MQLEAIPLFRQLNEAERKTLRLIAQEKKVKAGEVIFNEGDAGDGVYFVKAGLVEISAGKTDRRVFSQLAPGEIFGEMAMLEHEPRSATASCPVDSEIYYLPKGEMLPFLERSPGVAFILLQQISHRLRDFNKLHLRELVEAESLAVIGRFAQGIVHDLKNPLSVISLSADMFDMPGVNPEARAKAQLRIRKQVERVSDMVSDILVFTNTKKNQSQVQGMRPAEYRKFILELLPDLRSEAELKSVQIELENVPPGILLRFDPRRLNRVFFNLIGNATSIMLDGGKIFIRFKCNEREMITEIEDTGPGIAPEIAEKIFRPFVTFGKASGTGLGLSICKKIIEDHGGTITARSEPGRGAVFAFALPVAG